MAVPVVGVLLFLINFCCLFAILLLFFLHKNISILFCMSAVFSLEIYVDKSYAHNL